MVRPTAFYSNKETLIDNKFMSASTMHEEESTFRAQLEFDSFQSQLRKAGVGIETYE